MRRLVLSLLISLVGHLALLALGVNGLSGSGAGNSAGSRLTVNIRNSQDQESSAPTPPAPLPNTTAPSPAEPRPTFPQPDSTATVGSQPSCHPLLTYFATSQLTRKPRVIRDLASRDPDELKGRPESGRLLAELCIETDGHVSRVNVIESDLPEIFTEVVVRNFGQVLFAPGEIDGRAVRSISRIEVRFAPPAPAPAPAVIERVPLTDETPLRPEPTAREN